MFVGMLVYWGLKVNTVYNAGISCQENVPEGCDRPHGAALWETMINMLVTHNTLSAYNTQATMQVCLLRVSSPTAQHWHSGSMSAAVNQNTDSGSPLQTAEMTRNSSITSPKTFFSYLKQCNQDHIILITKRGRLNVISGRTLLYTTTSQLFSGALGWSSNENHYSRGPSESIAHSLTAAQLPFLSHRIWMSKCNYLLLTQWWSESRWWKWITLLF